MAYGTRSDRNVMPSAARFTRLYHEAFAMLVILLLP
jgi:hypothetical protein